MDQHVLADERRFFDRVDFRGMKSADQQPALWIPNLDRRDWVVGGGNDSSCCKEGPRFHGRRGHEGAQARRGRAHDSH